MNPQPINPSMRSLEFDTPIGRLLIAADEAGLRHVVFSQSRYRLAAVETWRTDAQALAEPQRQLLAYFAGELDQFDLPLAPHGTPFQLRAWHALQAIPFGQTRSYAEQATAIGSPTAVRAIGGANSRNPLPIVIPCHRVIGKDGSLTGFGGGIDTKRWLLVHEQRLAG